MVRMSVQISEEQKLMLRALAVARNTSMSDVLREALARYIAPVPAILCEAMNPDCDLGVSR
jgi:predicted transcriptional regulator